MAIVIEITAGERAQIARLHPDHAPSSLAEIAAIEKRNSSG
jgi:hypothetical protein